jgi:putative membrane protein
MRHVIAAASVLTALAVPATAQIGNPAGVDPATSQSAPGVPAPNTANTQDKLFAQLIAAGGLAMVELGKMAEAKAQQNNVKQFARRMIEDHSKTNDDVERLAKLAQISLSGEIGPDDVVMKQRLETLAGSGFDLAYIQGQLVAHQKAVLLLQYEIGQGQDSALQKLAAESLPAVIAHLRMARDLMDDLTGAATTTTVGARESISPR